MMRFVFVVVVIFLLNACNSPEPATVKEPTAEEKISTNIIELKKLVTNGDLVVRLNDDIISDRVRYINEKDHSYSHTGIIVERGNRKFVAHIAPEMEKADTIQFIPIDSFINPAKHISCALYRYTMSEVERNALARIIDSMHQAKVTFDKHYILETDDQLYCSEMVYKALKQATGNRIDIKKANVPKTMHKAIASFFAEDNLSNKDIAERKIITIDNLYLRPDCKKIMQFQLKYFPDQVQ